MVLVHFVTDHREASLILVSVLSSKSGHLKPVEAILWGSLGPDPLIFWQWGPNVHGPPLFTVVLYAVPVNINADFTRLFDCMYTLLHQNVWQRVSELCLDPRRDHDMEGKED